MGHPQNPHPEPIRLGLMAPLTGLVRMYGIEISLAGRIACERINAAGGIAGRPLELITLDDGSLPDTAVPAADALVREFGCRGLIGNLLSNSRIAVADRVADPLGVPYLNFSFYEGSIDSRWFFHFAALPNQQIDRMIPYMARRFGPKMYFAGSNYEWPLGSIDAAKRALADRGGDTVGEAYLEIGEERIDHLLDDIARSGADVLVPYFAGADQIRFLTRFAERGLKGRMAVVMGHYDEAMVRNLRPPVREGLFSSNTYFMSLDTPENHDYLRRLAEQPEVTGIWPRGNGVLTNFGEGAHLCVQAFAAAAEAAGDVDDPEALRRALCRVEVTGPQGRVIMDPDTQHAAVNTHLAQCQADGRFEIIESFGRIAPRIPERYRNPQETRSRHAPLPASAAVSPPPRKRLPMGIAVVDRQARPLYCNPSLGRILGRQVGDLDPDRPLFGDAQELAAALRLARRYGEWRGPLSFRTGTGEHKGLEVTMAPLPVQYDADQGFVLSCAAPDEAPATDDWRLETSRQILSVADIAVIAADANGRILQANHHATELFGYPAEELPGLSVHLLLPPQYRKAHARHIAHFLTAPETEIRMGHRGEIVGYRKDGSQFPAEASISKFEGPDGWVLVASLHDISERKRVEEALTWKATHDPLTNLPNRGLIRDRLDNALARSQRYGGGVALLFVDLDNFKLVNDSHGHDAGDRLLLTVSNRLVNAVRPGDTVARFGGDEFVVLCENVRDPADVSALPDRIMEALRRPIELAAEELITTASIGLAYGAGATHTAEDLLRNADTAMYLAKEEGRDGWRIFNDDLHAEARQRLAVITGLRSALKREEMQVRLQPIMDRDGGRILGAEMLLRWISPDGEISPGVFIPIAETTGAIHELGLWVFEQACRCEARCRDLVGAEHAPYISVNLSARQFGEDDLVQSFRDTVQRTGARPDRLLLEITETALMADAENNLEMLRQLAEIGLHVAVDDFGTGYSSLAQLLRMPVNTIKIDQVFVHGLGQRRDSEAIVSAVLRMAEALELRTVAEGVETETQWTRLRELGADALQGFLFHRPMEEAAFLELLRRQDGEGS